MCALVLILRFQQHGKVFPVGEQEQAHRQEHSNPVNYIWTKIHRDGFGAYEQAPSCREEVYTVGFIPEKVGMITKESPYPRQAQNCAAPQMCLLTQPPELLSYPKSYSPCP